MVDRIARKARLLCLIGSLSLWLASCQTPTPLPESTDFPEAVVVQFTPALRIITPVLEACAAEDPDLALFLEETPRPEISLDDQADGYNRLSLALGEALEESYSVLLTHVPIVVVVHPSNSVDKLDAAELRGLFTGQVQKWAEMGGSEQPVTPWVLTPADESRQLFEAVILGREKIFGQARLAADPGWMLAGVSADAGAVGYIPSAWLDESVKTVALGPSLEADLHLPLLAAAAREPQGAARRLLICLQSGNGQAFLNELFQAP